MQRSPVYPQQKSKSFNGTRLCLFVLLFRKYRYDISGITTKAPYEAAFICERYVSIEISDFVMRTFVLMQDLSPSDISGITTKAPPRKRVVPFARRSPVSPYAIDKLPLTFSKSFSKPWSNTRYSTSFASGCLCILYCSVSVILILFFALPNCIPPGRRVRRFRAFPR